MRHMVEALDLDPRGYTGAYKLLGGRPSLDLVNTISWPGTDREHDWLQTPGNVRRWLTAVGLDTVPIVEADLPELWDLRRTITSAIRPLAHGQHPPSSAVRALNDHLVTASRRRRIEPQTLSWMWAPPQQASDAFAPIVVDAADVLTLGDRQRLKHCPSCDWVFVDETRNGRRRWCDMADCGSRAKARSYYHRHKT